MKIKNKTYRTTDLLVVIYIAFKGLLELRFKVSFVIEAMMEAKSDMMSPKDRWSHGGV